jgi:hypothetical protein
MTRWQKFAGTLASLVLTGGIVLPTTAPSLAGMTAAERPVAVVEEVKGKVAGVEFMDYVTPGKVIKLGPKGSIVLGYMTSCWRETITGGTVVVGVEQSLVHLAEIKRVKVDCGGEPSIDQQTRESAGTVFRGPSPPSKAR